jgi:hypothetical protein
MIEHESPERKNYFQHQIDFAVQGNVTEIAAALIVQYQQEGSVDWDQEEYIVESHARGSDKSRPQRSLERECLYSCKSSNNRLIIADVIISSS